MFEKFTKILANLFGDKSEIFESTQMALEERITSPFYGYFVFSWLLVNWNFVYAALFVSQDKIFEKTGLLRSDYLFSQILPGQYSRWYFIDFIILPFVLTLSFFWIFPFINEFFYRKNLKNKKSLEIIRLQETRAVVLEKTKLIKEETRKTEAERQAEKVNPERLWEKEYEAFRQSQLFSQFPVLKESIYGGYNSQIKVTDHSLGYERTVFQIPQEIITYADANDLVSISGNQIALTQKGKYFMRRYVDEYVA